MPELKHLTPRAVVQLAKKLLDVLEDMHSQMETTHKARCVGGPK
jgi:hypothetical protein